MSVLKSWMFLLGMGLFCICFVFGINFLVEGLVKISRTIFPPVEKKDKVS